MVCGQFSSLHDKQHYISRLNHTCVFYKEHLARELRPQNRRNAKKKNFFFSLFKMISDDEDIYKVNARLEKLKLSELPSGIGNSILKLRLQQESESNPPSNYNSDTDEPAPRKRDQKEKVKHKVDLNKDYNTREKKVTRQDFQTLCVLGRGA